MGFEYKLRMSLTDKQAIEIQDLLKSCEMFDKKHKFNHKVLWDFRKVENSGDMPNMSIIFEEDGIYVCQYGSSHLWTNLNKLKNYITKEKIDFEIIDYQD